VRACGASRPPPPPRRGARTAARAFADAFAVAEVEPRNKVAARWTGPHEVVRCLSAHRYEVEVKAAAGESMYHQLELDAERIKTCPLRELVGEAAVGDEDA
jgi:hypothetical protein